MTQQSPPRAQLLITLTAEGGVNVQGPIKDKVLCYGMLDCARDAIKDFADKQAAVSKIIPAQMADPFLLKKGNHA